MLGSYVRVKVTNPIHSLNTQFGFDYKLNYGTIEGKKVFGSSPACAYILGVNQPVRTYDGRVVAVLKRSDGTSVYLLTHTISKNYYGSRFVFKCQVRAGGDYLNYVFEGDDNMDDMATTYRNSEGYSGGVYGGNSPVARAIYEYICRH